MTRFGNRNDGGRGNGGGVEERQRRYARRVAAILFAGAAAAAAAGAVIPAAYAQQTGGGQTAPSGGQTAPGAPGAPTTPGTPTGTGPGSGQGQPGPAGAPAATSGQRAPAVGGGAGSRQIQGNTSPDYDLERTIRESLASSSQLVNAQKQIAIDDKRVDEAESENRPKVTGTASATRFDSNTTISLGGSPPIEFIGNHTEALSLNAEQKIDVFGQVKAARSQVRLQQLADRAILSQIRQDRTLQAKTIYFNLLRAQHEVQVAESALRDAATQEAIARRLYENQVGQKIDLLRAETNSAQAQQNLTAAQNDLDVARASFNDLVGRPLDAPVNAADVPGVSVGVDVAPGGNGSVGSESTQTGTGFTPFAVPPAAVQRIDVDSSIATAQANRPEVLQSAALARAEEVGVRIAREGMEPTFSFGATGNIYPTTSFQFPRSKNAAFTISASMPFYDGGRTRALVSEAKLRTEQAKTTLESTKSDVALQVRQAYLNLATAARQIDAANAALTQAIAARQLAQVRYEGQVGLFLEVTDAQAALVRAEFSQVDAVYNYLTAKAQFENAVGVPVERQTNSLTVDTPVGTTNPTGGNSSGAPATPAAPAPKIDTAPATPPPTKENAPAPK